MDQYKTEARYKIARRHLPLGILALLCPLLLSLGATAQQGSPHRMPQGTIEIVGDRDVTKLVEKHIAFNEMGSTTPGYRIQIASLSGSNSKQQAFVIKDRFLTSYPNTQVYIIFEEPNFKIKVGDFRTRLEAFAFLQEIRGVFAGHIVQDHINPEPPDYDLVPETDADAEY